VAAGPPSLPRAGRDGQPEQAVHRDGPLPELAGAPGPQAQPDGVASTRDRQLLHFSASGQETIERAYRTHWVARPGRHLATPGLDLRLVWRNRRSPTHGGNGPDLLGLRGPGSPALPWLRQRYTDPPRKEGQPAVRRRGAMESCQEAR